MADNYAIGDFTYQAASVDAVSVNWYLGVIEVRESDAEILSVQETGENLSDQERMHWYLDGTTLRIEFCESKYYGKFESAEKHLILEVPKHVSLSVNNTSGVVTLGDHTLKELNLQTVSGNFSAGHLEAEKIDIRSSSGAVRLADVNCEEGLLLKTVSGRVSVQKLCAEGLDAESVSGDIDIGTLEVGGKVSVETESGAVALMEVRTSELEVETVSASVKVVLFACENATLDTTSGNVTVQMKDNFDATFDYDTASGKLNTKQHWNKQDGYAFGDGACRIRVKTVSGNLTVE